MSILAPTNAPTERLSLYLRDFGTLQLVGISIKTKHMRMSQLRKYIDTQCIIHVIQICSKTIQEFFNHLFVSGYSYSGIKQFKTAISQFCDYLVQIEVLNTNPVANTRNPAIDSKPMPHYLDDVTTESVCHYAAEIPIATDWTLYAPIILALKSGLTINEIQMIEWKNFDFCVKLLNIWRPKTNRVRTIPLHSMIIAAFGPCRDRSRYVFSKGSGRHYSIRSWHNWLEPVKKRVPELRGWHDFRRTFAVKLCKAGVPPVEIMHYLGHANLETTMRYMNYAPSNYNENIENA